MISTAALYHEAWSHRIRKDEVRQRPTDDGTVIYELEIRDHRIRRGYPIDVYVLGDSGWEPASCFSRKGNGTVFRKMRFSPGTANLVFADHANQIVRDPTGMKLRFLIRPTLEELTGRV